ncbi:MAG: hypothetical protein Q7J33_05880 [Serpentinimonas sp.]|nr:hypothetical protein [Serpentinimonas sp.]
MKLQKWLVLSVLVIGASAQAAEGQRHHQQVALGTHDLVASADGSWKARA